jgi:hypothetical protein
MSKLHARRKWLAALPACVSAAALLYALDGKVRAVPLRSDPISDAEMERLWVDLEGTELQASRALLKLSTEPKQVVAFLKGKMKPLKIDAKQVNDLIDQLGNDKEEIWKPAFEELEYLDPRLAIDLRTLMANVPDSPARQRMVAVMSGRNADYLIGKKVELPPVNKGEGFNFLADGSSWWAEHRVALINTKPWGNLKKKWTRATRAIVLLEHFGTPDALTILKNMADGHEEAGPTVAAKEAIDRLTRKLP